jgi:hypothetical protein
MNPSLGLLTSKHSLASALGCSYLKALASAASRMRGLTSFGTSSFYLSQMAAEFPFHTITQSHATVSKLSCGETVPSWIRKGKLQDKYTCACAENRNLYLHLILPAWRLRATQGFLVAEKPGTAML